MTNASELSLSSQLGPATPHVTTSFSSSPIFDTAATGHFFGYDGPVVNKQIAFKPISVECANKQRMLSTHTAELDMHQLPKQARTVHLFANMNNTYLLSIGQLCDAGCEAHFNDTMCSITYNNKPILIGTRNDSTNRLWKLQMPTKDSPTTELALAMVNFKATPSELVRFSHATLCSAVPSTIEEALKSGLLTDFPGLTLKSFRKHTPKSAATIKGHLDTTRKNTQSTKTDTLSDEYIKELLEDHFPSDTLSERTHYCFATIFHFDI